MLLLPPYLFLLHLPFRFDIAAIRGRTGDLHASVGVGRVLATLELSRSVILA